MLKAIELEHIYLHYHSSLPYGVQTVQILANSSNISFAWLCAGIDLKITADFSLNAALQNTKYLLVRGVIGSLIFDPKYSFPW